MDTNYLRLIYDRGTIVLAGLRADDPLAAVLPGARWDSRVGVLRAPGCRAARLRHALRRLGRDFRDELRPAGLPPTPWRPVSLRPYQEAALSAWRLAGHRGVVVLPTGAGKTRIALAAMARLGVRALCLAPTRMLMHQWRREIARFYPGPVGCFGDGERALGAISVATFESAYRQMATIGNRFELLIVDEAHHFGSGWRDEALEMAIAPARLGLTATPVRDPRAAGRIAELVGPTVLELAVAELSGTFLAELDVRVLELELTPDERRAYEADRRAFLEVRERHGQLGAGASWDEFLRAAASTPEGRAAIAAWQRTRRLLALPAEKSRVLAELLERHRERRVLVFTFDNDTAYAIARRHLIMPLTCDIRRHERDEVLARFRSGELSALVSAQVLNEGIDVPDADVAIVVGGARGAREHVQRVGRLLRPAPGKRATVYELVMRHTGEARQASNRRAALGLHPATPR